MPTYYVVLSDIWLWIRSYGYVRYVATKELSDIFEHFFGDLKLSNY